MPVGPEAEDPLDRSGMNETEPPGTNPRARLDSDAPARGALGWPAADQAVPRRYPAHPSPSGYPAFVRPGEYQAPAARNGQPRLVGQPRLDGQPRVEGRPRADGQSRPDRRPRVPRGLAVAAALGVAGLVASLIGVAGQVLPRKFSATQQHQIMAWQVASRWRIWPAGKTFPASIGYTDSAAFFGSGTAGLTLHAHRAGIAAQSSCAERDRKSVV